MMNVKLSVALLAAALSVGLFSAASLAAETGDSGYAVQKTLPVGGEGRWDYATFDPSANLLFVTRSTHTQGIDVASGKVVIDVKGQKRSHGTAIVPAVGRGFITDGGDGTIQVFDLKTGETLGKITAAQDADGCIYDAGTNRVLASCGDAGKLAIVAPDVDPKTGKADLVDLGGSPEFLAADGAGKAYVNLNDKNQIAVVDLKTLAVVNRWPTGAGTKPTGLAIDAKNHRLFVGCRNQKLVVMSTEDGHVLGEFNIGKGNDACAFDPGTGDAFASCGDGTLTVLKQTSPGQFSAAGVQTRAGARTMTVDPSTHILYLPTADFDAPAGNGPRPAMKAGSFMIVVVAPTSQK